MNSIEGITLYIKRAEEHHTKEYIIQAFAINNIGKVSNTTFIKKTSEQGSTYNGVIVEFERWTMSPNVTKLFDEINQSKDCIAKFYHNKHQYWFLQIHTTKTKEMVVITDTNISDKEKIMKLEEMVRSLTAQNYYMQTRHEKMENMMMDYERKHTIHHIKNTELSGQLTFEELDKNYYIDKTDELIKQNDKLQEENEIIRCKLACTAMKLTSVENDFNSFKQELIDKTNELQYYIDNYEEKFTEFEETNYKLNHSLNNVKALEQEVQDTTNILVYVEQENDELKQLISNLANKFPSVNKYLKPIIHKYPVANDNNQ